MARGIYSLIHVSDDGTESTFRIKYQDGKIKDHFPLTTLDYLTTKCKNMEELLLVTRAVNFPKKNSKDNWIDGYFYIQYKNNHETKKLDVVFSDNELIHETAAKNNGKYTMDKSKIFKTYAYKLIKIRKNQPELYNYLKENGYLGRYLSELIGRYLFYYNNNYQNINESDRAINEIAAKLLEYKVFRDLIVGKYNYEKEKEIKQNGNEEKEVTETQKVKKLLPPKGTQLSFNDIDYNL